MSLITNAINAQVVRMNDPKPVDSHAELAKPFDWKKWIADKMSAFCTPPERVPDLSGLPVPQRQAMERMMRRGPTQAEVQAYKERLLYLAARAGAGAQVHA